MNSIRLNKSITGFALTFAIAFGFIALMGTSVNAQNSRDDDYSDNQDDRYDRNRNDQYGDRRNQDNERYNGRDRNGNQSIRFAFQRGYQKVMRQGIRDARNRHRGNSGYGNVQGYGNNNGYYGNNQGYGNNGRIQRAYQQGFQRGYQEGIQRGRNNGRNSSYYPF